MTEKEGGKGSPKGKKTHEEPQEGDEAEERAGGNEGKPGEGSSNWRNGIDSEPKKETDNKTEDGRKAPQTIRITHEGPQTEKGAV